MPEILELTDGNWQEIIADKPALILLSKGEGLRGDFSAQFKKSAQESKGVVFAQVDIKKNPQLASQFEVTDKPVLVGFWCGDSLIRRVRPWGTDVVMSLDLLNERVQEQNKTMSEETNMEKVIPNNKPVAVSDATFEAEVISYSEEMPVIVDFWAEWCGPCRMVAPVLDKLAGEYAGQVRIAKVDTDANPGLSQAFRIMSIPTIMIFKKGHIIFSQPGALPEAAFRQLFDQAVALDVEKAIAEHEAQHGHHEHDHDGHDHN